MYILKLIVSYCAYSDTTTATYMRANLLTTWSGEGLLLGLDESTCDNQSRSTYLKIWADTTPMRGSLEGVISRENKYKDAV